ncbi:MAG: UDP-glucose/GDP-mannose dehydrogenase family protein [Deltaproteobacteria bacterium]|nr:UDP-glucose/GDP-mannose dehydrogenase family protein [Deltaproteobacteria bacterium]
MKETLSIIGLGKLGLCTAACFAKAGFAVIGMDLRTEYVEDLNAGKTPFFETGLQCLLAQTRENMTFTPSLAEAFYNSTVSFIIVPTPSRRDGAFSNEHILSVLQQMGPLLAEKKPFHIVNVVSTVMPGSCQEVFIPLLEKLSRKTAGKDFGVAYNPEFIAIGSVIENFLNPDLVLIGESDKRTGDILEEIYKNTCGNQPHMARSNLINAEITKLAINCYCTMKISFANNLAAICDNVSGANAAKICQMLGYDSRIGPKYINPGLGFGGPCFPRDNEAFIKFIEQQNGLAGLQQAVVQINNAQPKRFAEKPDRTLTGS